MLNRRHFLNVTLAGVSASALGFAAGKANAQTVDQLQIFVPAAPGGGWDQTARTMEPVLRTDEADRPTPVHHVPGAGGAVGLPQFVDQAKGHPQRADGRRHGDGRGDRDQQVAVQAGPVTPIARLTGEFEVSSCSGQAPIKT